MHEFGSVVGLRFGNGRPKGRGRQGSAMPKVVRALVPPKPIIPKHTRLYQSTPTHTHTTMHKHSQTCTPAHTFAHPHILPDTSHTYPLLILLSLNVFGQVWTNHSYLNRPNTKKGRKREKRRNKSPLKHFSGLKNWELIDSKL